VAIKSRRRHEDARSIDAFDDQLSLDFDEDF
jgi:hypothetical protein